MRLSVFRRDWELGKWESIWISVQIQKVKKKKKKNSNFNSIYKYFSSTACNNLLIFVVVVEIDREKSRITYIYIMRVSI